ncbi:Pectinesterase inhibitor domain containing protein [Parasponia andersonii]|uniref:Pectinesterase inhibitor domain containing protein n=1 Tax=Parasponia andersonii TaxID=3476 RepID=A0A2P5C9K1_PARAD|nr:Pectinesterase inhibitor domain containing protein [Parasponia andersonii]
MATHRFSHCLLSLFLAILSVFSTTIQASSSSSGRATTILKPTELVDGVCNKTSNYSFCVESLYADPRTPRADSYGLAFVVFGMSYLNATGTQDLIAELSKKAKRGGQHDQPLLTRLQRCGKDYEKAVSALEMAYNDLNSETFFELAEMAGVASTSAEDCQAGFEKRHHSPPLSLSARNHELRGLCEICVVVSKLFTGGT